MTTWTREELIEAGEKLFGREWQAPLARYLHMDDRTIRRWVATDPGTDLLSSQGEPGGRNLRGPAYRAIQNALLLLELGVKPPAPPARGRPPKSKPEAEPEPSNKRGRKVA